MSSAPKRSVMMMFRRGLVWALGAGIIIYAGLAFWGGRSEVMGELARFSWPLLAPILVLSLGNYLIRFARWELYLRTLGIRVRPWTSISVFMAGLAMTITPGKVGEFLKSYLLRETDGIPMTRTAPVVFMERVTDLLALVALASAGVGTYYESGTWILVVSGAAMVVGVAILYSKTLCLALLKPLHRVPKLGKIATGLEDSYLAAHELTRPVPLLAGLALGAVAWTCECMGFHLCFVGLGEEMAAGASIFVYAFSTIAGVVSPGGLGMTDVSLIAIARQLSETLTEPTAVTASFLVRACTLWFAIAVGALFLLRFSTPLQVDVETARAGDDTAGDPKNPPSS
jgi:glycosyltransferase 2 family protein